MKKASIVDVAKMAGVSIATVSNVCTGNKYVSKELREVVLDAIVKLNYKPNYLASSLRSQRSRMIAVMIPYYTMEYYGEMLQGIQDGAAALGYLISTFETRSSIAKEIEYISLSSEYMASGVIILSQALDCDDDERKSYLELLSGMTRRDPKIPIVSVMRETGVKGVDEILLDGVNSAADAVRHLISLGHKSIGMIAGGLDSAVGRDRFAGYRLALDEAGIAYDEKKVISNINYSPVKAFYNMQELIKATDVTAVFTSNDRIAMGALKGARALGADVPHDISVIGYDGVPTCELMSPTLSTVHVSSYDIGHMAMEKIGKRLSGDDTDYEPVVIRPKIVVRESTAPPKGN